MALRHLEPLLRNIRRLLAQSTAGSLTDGNLLERFAQRHEQTAFTALVERHGAMVWSVCRRLLTDEHEAEDAFQASFLVLARRAASIRQPGSLASWLYGVTYRVALKARSRAGRRRQLEQPLREPTPDTSDGTAAPGMEAALRELRSVMDEELLRLPPKYRDPLVLCYFEGKTKDEAAKELGWPEGTVSGRLARGRELLRRRLTGRGLAFSTALMATLLTQAHGSAAVPSALLSATVQAALTAGTGQAAAVSATVIALVEGVLRDMFQTKLKFMTLGVLALALLGILGGIVSQRWSGVAQTSARAGESAAPVDGPAPDRGQRTGGWRERFTLDGHKSGVESLAFGPTGSTLAAAGQFTVRLWNLGSGDEIKTLAGESLGCLTSVGLSPDGKILATASDYLNVKAGDEKMGVVKLWMLPEGKEQRTLEMSGSQLVFSPDGKVLAIWEPNRFPRGVLSDTDRVSLWDLEQNKPRGQAQVELGETVTAIAFAPDGKTLAIASSEGKVELWDTEVVKRLATLRGHRGSVGALAFTADNKTLISANVSPASRWNEVKLWDVAARKERITLRGHQFQGGPAVVSPDGRTLAVARLVKNARDSFSPPDEISEVKLWDLTSGEELAVLRGHEGKITAMAFSGSGNLLATGSDDETVKIWHRPDLGGR
jgi:RNA polymerase sigma factor (sigma-70 family)